MDTKEGPPSSPFAITTRDASAGALKLNASSDSDLLILHIDVDQGESTVIMERDKGVPIWTVVIDGGFAAKGTGALIRYLHQLKVTKVDALICSHFDGDHTKGLTDFIVHHAAAPKAAKPSPAAPPTTAVSPLTAALPLTAAAPSPAVSDQKSSGGAKAADPSKLIPVEQLLVRNASLKTYKSTTKLQLLGAATAKGIPYRAIRQGEPVCKGKATLSCVRVDDGEACSENNGSIGLIVEVGDQFRYFTAGDLESGGEMDVLDTLKPLAKSEHLNADGDRVLTAFKCGHHGSAHSTSRDFVDLARPLLGFVSCGDQTYGHPSYAVIERLLRHGSPLEHVYFTNCVHNRNGLNPNYPDDVHVMRKKYEVLLEQAMGADDYAARCRGLSDIDYGQEYADALATIFPKLATLKIDASDESEDEPEAKDTGGASAAAAVASITTAPITAAAVAPPPTFTAAAGPFDLKVGDADDGDGDGDEPADVAGETREVWRMAQAAWRAAMHDEQTIFHGRATVAGSAANLGSVLMRLDLASGRLSVGFWYFEQSTGIRAAQRAGTLEVLPISDGWNWRLHTEKGDRILTSRQLMPAEIALGAAMCDAIRRPAAPSAAAADAMPDPEAVPIVPVEPNSPRKLQDRMSMRGLRDIRFGKPTVVGLRGAKAGKPWVPFCSVCRETGDEPLLLINCVECNDESSYLHEACYIDLMNRHDQPAVELASLEDMGQNHLPSVLGCPLCLGRSSRVVTTKPCAICNKPVEKGRVPARNKVTCKKCKQDFPNDKYQLHSACWDRFVQSSAGMVDDKTNGPAWTCLACKTAAS